MAADSLFVRLPPHSDRSAAFSTASLRSAFGQNCKYYKNCKYCLQYPAPSLKENHTLLIRLLVKPKTSFLPKGKKGLTIAHKSFFFFSRVGGGGKVRFLKERAASHIFKAYRRGFAPPLPKHFERS